MGAQFVGFVSPFQKKYTLDLLILQQPFCNSDHSVHLIQWGLGGEHPEDRCTRGRALRCIQTAPRLCWVSILAQVWVI